jgi:uncharacterized protein YdhG (YjbR/CyaY superfamily)
MSATACHANYISAAPEALRPLLEQLRSDLADALPDATEVIKYNMPGFEIGTAIIAGYAAFSKQCGLYVAPHAITALEKEITQAGLKATKTGVTFSPVRPIPSVLVKKLAVASREGRGT